jgi:hypothetical protein
MARASGRKYNRDASGRFASGGRPSASFTRGDAEKATRSNQPSRAAARARDNSDRASGNMRLARMVSTTAPKSAKALHAYNAKQGKKASRSKRTAERARKYYKSQGL